MNLYRRYLNCNGIDQGTTLIARRIGREAAVVIPTATPASGP